MLDFLADMERTTAMHRLLEFARQHSVRAVDLKFVDLTGRGHHLTLPVDRLEPQLFTEGIAFDGSSILGYGRRTTSDMTLLPDPEAVFLDPFWDRPTLSLMCDVFEGDGQPSARDPRGVARRAETWLRHSGLADTAMMSPEFEFYVFDSVRTSCRENRIACDIETEEGEWNADRPGARGTHLPLRGGYHALPPRDRLYRLRDEIVRFLEGIGVAVKYHHHEGGGPGQSEIEVLSQPLLRAADLAMTVKYIARMTADRAGRVVTFMPKPMWNVAGNGMHVHQHLFLEGQPLFWDADGWAGLSPFALHYVGGLLHHGPALLGLTNPSTNSYVRLVPGFEAPMSFVYGLANRNAAVRVPAAGRTPQSKRIEFRASDATGNVYLTLAAMLMAGMDGVRRGIDPRAAGFGPFDESFEVESDPERPGPPPLPRTLEEALVALENDHEFLLEGGVFDRDLLGAWIELKWSELQDVRCRPHPREIELYLDV
jgi:glutamine synthetase